MPLTKEHSSPSIFPTFLLPPAPFRRSKTSGRSSSPTGTDLRADKTGAEKYLDGHISYIRCARCSADLCLTSQIISKGFTGRHGRAYLVSADPLTCAISMGPSSSPTTSLPNTITQRAVPRQLVTGAHTVSDISCLFCGSVLGWKYVAAEEESQRYKVGKFILETKRITTSSCWETNVKAPSNSPDPQPSLGEARSETLDGNVEFDSQDEAECEDLFAGVWSPSLAIRRRSRKFERRSAVHGSVHSHKPQKDDKDHAYLSSQILKIHTCFGYPIKA
ncbi:hypothetical protein VTN00DRAFT_4583 [Thermoascus crustaceus]|uniref:uncharacterized protein n=1 Tax=Thermoascus crustaceus TaxID=5088 RepID=UPI0037421C9D